MIVARTARAGFRLAAVDADRVRGEGHGARGHEAAQGRRNDSVLAVREGDGCTHGGGAAGSFAVCEGLDRAPVRRGSREVTGDGERPATGQLGLGVVGGNADCDDGRHRSAAGGTALGVGEHGVLGGGH